MVDAPGNGLANSSQAPSTVPAPSVIGTTAPGTTAPVESVAKKLELVSVAGLTARENITCGREGTPTLPTALVGVRLAIVSNGRCGSERLSVSLVVLPAASVAVSASVCAPMPRRDRSSGVSNVPSFGLKEIGITVPPSNAYDRAAIL